MSAAAVALIVVSVSGCGGGGGLPSGDTGTVTGSVTYNGQPVPQGTTVVFLPAGGGAGAVMANGTVDEAGNYSLTMRNGPDILTGKYMVGVTPPPTGTEMTPDEIMQMDKPPETPPPPFPAKYLSAETSGVNMTVAAGENSLDITMTD